jgi:hypothetical protein
MPKGIPKNKKVKVEASNESQNVEVSVQPVVGSPGTVDPVVTVPGETEVVGNQVVPLRKEGIVVR